MDYNMAQLEEIGISDGLFILREQGERAFTRLRALFQEVPDGQPLVLRFPPDQLIDASFADESILRLAAEVIEGQHGNRSILLGGLSENSIHNIEAAIHFQGLKLAFLVIEPGRGWRFIGHLEANLKDTLQIVAQHTRITAPELSSLLGVAINTASNRLKRLFDRRLVRRTYEITAKGLQYVYHFWEWGENPGELNHQEVQNDRQS